MSLMHLSVGKQISSFNEKSEEARACALFYDTAKDEVLRAFAWPFATLTVSLQLVQQQPTPEWGYSYRLPSDCLAARRLLLSTVSTGPFPSVFSIAAPYNTPLGRVPTAQNRIPYRIMADAQGGLLYTDVAPVPAIPASPTSLGQPQLPLLEYTAEQDSPQFYASDFCQALAFRLASYVGPSLTGGDKFGLAKTCLQLYYQAIVVAQANAGNEEQPDQPAEAEAMRSRLGFTGGNWG